MQRLWTIALALSLAACMGEIPGGDDDDDQPVVCEQARTYAGFGNRTLEADRPTIEPGSDRLRIKPYGALAAEYRAALGLSAFDTSLYAATFGRPPARWYIEPQASANTVYAAFALAFDACSQHTTADALYATAPNAQLADIVCRDHARKFWNREPTDAEASACATYAVDKTDPADAPAKRWAYSCAAVLSASGFLAY